MSGMDTTVNSLPFTGLSTSRGSSRIRLNSSLKNVHAVDKVVSFSPMKNAYQVLFTDGSTSWVTKLNINSVLTTEFGTREFVNSFNEGRDVSQGHVFLYLRTSRGSQESSERPLHPTEDSTSIEVQKMELSSFAKEAKLQLQGIGMDMGRSAKDMKNLHGLEFLCDQIEEFVESDDQDNPRGPVFLYVWNVSRFSRNSPQAVSLLEKLTSLGVTVFFKEEGVTYTTAAGRHTVRTALSAAQLHSEGTSELVKKVIQLKKSRGELKTRGGKFFVPYGKQLLPDGSLGDNSEELEAIASAVKLHKKTKNAVKTVKLLATKGIRLRHSRITEAMVKSFVQ